MNVKASLKYRLCWFKILKKMSVEQKAEVIDSIIAYVENEEFEYSDFAVETYMDNLCRTWDLDKQYDAELSDGLADLSAKRAEAGRKGAEARKASLERQKSLYNGLTFEVEPEDDDDFGEGEDGTNFGKSEVCQNLPNGKSGKRKQPFIKKKETKDKEENTPPKAPLSGKSQNPKGKRGKTIAVSHNGTTHNASCQRESVSAFQPPTLEAWQCHADKIGWKGKDKIETHNEVEHAYRWYQQNGWCQANGRPIVDWQATCETAKINADKKAGRIPEAVILSLLDESKPPKGWKSELWIIHSDRIPDRDKLKPVRWAHIVNKNKKLAVRLMKRCLSLCENEQLLKESEV